MSLRGCWYEGNKVHALPVGLRTTHYGDGVFRTMLRYDDHLIDADAQLAKLLTDAGRFGLLADAAWAKDVERLFRKTMACDGMPAFGVIKAMLIRPDSGRGYLSSPQTPPNLVVFAFDLPNYPVTHWQEGVRCATLEIQLARQPLLAGIKHCNRAEQVLASMESEARELDEGLCLDTDGMVVCGTRSNIFWFDGRMLHTPALRSAGVHGHMRDRVIALAHARGIECGIHEHAASALRDAEAVMLCNSVVGVWPVRELDGRKLATDFGRSLHAGLRHPLPLASQ